MRRLILELAQKFRPVMVKLFPIDFLRAVKRRMIRQAVQQMRSYQLPTFSPSSRERGINLIGYIQGETGLGQSCRLVAGALEASGLPYTIYNYQQVSSIRSSDHSWDRKISDQAPYDINLFHITPYEVPLAFTTLTPKFWMAGIISLSGFGSWRRSGGVEGFPSVFPGGLDACRVCQRQYSPSN